MLLRSNPIEKDFQYRKFIIKNLLNLEILDEVDVNNIEFINQSQVQNLYYRFKMKLKIIKTGSLMKATTYLNFMMKI